MVKIDEPVRQPGDDAHIEPGRRKVKLARRGSFVVAVRRGRTPPLTQTEVAAVIDEIRRRDDRDDPRERHSRRGPNRFSPGT